MERLVRNRKREETDHLEREKGRVGSGMRERNEDTCMKCHNEAHHCPVNICLRKANHRNYRLVKRAILQGAK